MLYLIIGIFGLAAIFGIIILKNWLTSAHTSRTTVYVHGLFAAIGLGILVYYFSSNQTSNARMALILLGIAAIGGFYMFFRDLKGKFSPTWLAVIHALLAVTGVGFLLFMAI